MLSYRSQWLCAAAGFSVTLALYAWTLAPAVTLVDSGELIVAAQSLGVAHPPGFPLYVLLAHLATWLPLGTVAECVNFASALFGALAVGVLALAVAAALPARSSTKKKIAADSGTDDATAIIAVLVAALLLAFSRTLWSYATLAEVYTLNALLILLVLVLMLRWRRRTLEAAARRATPGATPDRLLYAAAFAFGLGLGVHHVTVALLLPALALLVFATAGGRFFASRRLAYAALCACAGLSVYVYLPIAAWREAGLNWSDPRTLQRIWWHLTGRQYQAYFSFAPGELSKQAIAFARHAGREFGPWWCPAGLLLIAAGIGALFQRDRVLLGFLALVVP